MGHYDSRLIIGETAKFKRTFFIVVALIGLERANAVDEFGSWLNSDAAAATSRVLPSSISEDQQLSATAAGAERGSTSTDLGKRVPMLETHDDLYRRKLASYSGLYIGYGALSASHTPCPPRSGRSYYTPNCRSATGPVRPYRRGCSAISRCARG